MKKLLCAMLAFLLAASASGCYAIPEPSLPTEQTESTTATGPSDAASAEVHSYPLPSENPYVASQYTHYCASSKGGMYLCSGQFLTYRSVDSDSYVTLCPQEGCKHNDFSCTAYMGGILYNLVEYNGKLYAVVKTEDEHYQVIQKDLENSEIKVIAEQAAFELTDTTQLSGEVCLMPPANGKLYYRVQRNEYDILTTELLSAKTTLTEDTEEAVELFSVDPASGKRTSLIRWTADENAWITMDSFLCTDTAIICVLRTSSIYEDEATSALECVYLEDGTKKTLRTVTDGQTIRVMGAVSAGLVVETGMLEEEPMDFATYQRSHPDVTEDEYSKYYFDAVEQNTKLVLELVSLDGTVLDTIADTKDGYAPPVSAGICWNETVIYRKGNLLYCYDSTTQEAMPLEADGDVINYFVYDGHVWQPYRQDNAVRCVVCDIHTGETAELFTISGGMPGIYAETDDNFLVVAESGILSIAKQDFYRGDFERGTVLVEYS